MFSKKIFYLLLFILSLNYALSAKMKISKSDFSFILDSEFDIAPYSIEPAYQNDGLTMNIKASAGFRFRKFNFLLSMFENYLTYGTQASAFKGATNIFRWTADFYYQINDWFRVYAGFGGALNISNYYYQNKINITRNNGGLSFISEAKIDLPFKYLGFSAVTRFDIFFSNYGAMPYFYGGLRFFGYPYFKWIMPYIEAGVYSYRYNSALISFVSTSFIFSAGVKVGIVPKALDAEFRDLKKMIETVKVKRNLKKNINNRSVKEETDGATIVETPDITNMTDETNDATIVVNPPDIESELNELEGEIKNKLEIIE